MFKNNYIQKLAFDNVKKQKAFYRNIFISLVLVFTLSSLISILFSSYEEIGYKERSARYGTWSLAFTESLLTELDEYKNDPDIETGYIYNMGQGSYQDHNRGMVNSVDNQGLKMLNLTLTEGRLPSRSDEIMIEESQFLILGIPKKINQNIKLSITTQQGTKVYDYKIVGIVKDYTNIFPLGLGSFITTGQTSTDSIVMFSSRDNLKLWNQIVEKKMSSQAIFNTSVYNDYTQISMNSDFKVNDATITLRYLVVFLGFIGVFGTMGSSISKRTENLTLMKAMGATSKQIQKMIVYESLILTAIAFVVGLILGLGLSFVILWMYHSLLESYFLFVVSHMFYMQIVFSFFAAIVGIFIPSFEVYSIPLTKQVKLNAYTPKKRKIRKLNTLTLALQEFRNYKVMSIFMIVVMLIGLFVGDMSYIYMSNYYSIMENTDESRYFDYEIEAREELLSPKDISSFTHIEGMTSQVVSSKDLVASWNGVEKEAKTIVQRKSLAENYQITDIEYCENVIMSTYSDEDMMRDILKDNPVKGRLPEKENEVLIVKPYMFVKDESHRSASITNPDSQDYIKDEGLEVGDNIQVYNLDSSHKQNTLTIVGTVFLEKVGKYFRLFNADYNLIVNDATFMKYYSDIETQNLFFDIEDNQTLPEFKQLVSHVMNAYQGIVYTDVKEEAQLSRMIGLEQSIKTISFFGILLCGIVILTYLHRKIKMSDRKYEFGLYRAIGMTKKTLYLVHLLYGLIIYLGTLLIYLTVWFLSISGQSGANLDDFINAALECLPIFILIGMGFICAFMLPIHSQIKESILDNISKD